jgi:hypothetical protein
MNALADASTTNIDITAEMLEASDGATSIHATETSVEMIAVMKTAASFPRMLHALLVMTSSSDHVPIIDEGWLRISRVDSAETDSSTDIGLGG